MNDKQISADLQWDIDRYLLGDEALDREAFEARMMEDESLALAVAESVQQFEDLSRACRAMPAVHEDENWPRGESDVSHLSRRQVSSAEVYRLIGLAAFAASLLLAVLIWQSLGGPGQRQIADGGTTETGSGNRLAEVADLWFAMDSSEVLASDSETFLISDGSDAMVVDDLSAESDWIIEATQQLYDRDGDI